MSIYRAITQNISISEARVRIEVAFCPSRMQAGQKQKIFSLFLVL